MNILVTGGTGFIGSHLIHKLLESNHEVFVLKRKNSDIWRIANVINKCKIYSYTNDSELERVFIENQIDLVMHLAAKYVKNNENNEQIEDMINTNVKFASQILDLAVKHNVGGFINTGTCFEYALSDAKINEENPIKPYNKYAETKVEFENIFKKYVLEKKIKGITLKLFYPYGEKDNKKLIPIVIDSLINEKPINLTKGEQKLDYTYVSDVVDAYIKSITFVFDSEDYQVFNIGTGKATKVVDIVGCLIKISKKQSHVNIGSSPYLENEIMHMDCDNNKAERILNWRPAISIENGLLKTYNYTINNYK